MRKWILTSVLVILTTTSFIHCGKKQEDVVVKVGSLSITSKDVVDLLKRKYPNKDNFIDLDIARKKELLEPLIVTKLRVNAAYDLNLEENEELQKKLANHRLRLIGGRYYERLIIDEIVSSEEVDKSLDRQGVEIKATHILIGHKLARRAMNRTKEEALNLANEIVEKLINGADFDTMVERYSNDPSAKKNKGDLGYFTWGRMLSEFQEAAWKLKIGEISDPVLTLYGYHIIRLDDRRPIPDYQPNRSPENLYRIKQMIVKTYGDSAKNTWMRHYKGLEEKYNYSVNEEAITSVSELLKEKIKNEKITPESFSPEQRDIIFSEWQGGSITLGDVINRYEKKFPTVMGSMRDAKNIRKEIERLSMNSLILLDAESYDISEEEFVVEQTRIFIERELDRIVEEDQVMGKITVEEAEELDYYQKNPQKFSKGKEIEIWEIFVNDKAEADKLVKQAKQGYNFEELAKKYSKDSRFKSKGGYLGYKTQNSRGTVSRKAHEIGPGGKIGGPVKYRRGWSVIKTGDSHEESVRPFSEVKKRANDLVKYQKVEERRAQWLDSLRDDYSVNIDEEKLKNI